MRKIAVIPARKGSKGLKDKNILPFCGKPLLVWSILQAKQVLDEVYVSSDSGKYLEIASQSGAKGIMRPVKLALDDSKTEDVIKHVARTLNLRNSDIIVILQPTSPLREPKDIQAAIDCHLENGGQTVIGVTENQSICLWGEEARPVTFIPKLRKPRQERPCWYIENGSIYVVDGTGNISPKPFFHVMEDWTRFDIDNQMDFTLAEWIFKSKCLNKDL